MKSRECLNPLNALDEVERKPESTTTSTDQVYTVEAPSDDTGLSNSKYHPACFARGRNKSEKANDQRILLFVPTEPPHNASEKIIFTKKIIASQGSFVLAVTKTQPAARLVRKESTNLWVDKEAASRVFLGSTTMKRIKQSVNFAV